MTAKLAAQAEEHRHALLGGGDFVDGDDAYDVNLRLMNEHLLQLAIEAQLDDDRRRSSGSSSSSSSSNNRTSRMNANANATPT